MLGIDKTVIIISGPTASGKTAIAIALAKKFHTEIISADSRQCYKELDIGVARPTPEELQEVKHHFIASHSLIENITAADFEKFALAKAQELFQRHEIVIMTGGTGLYIKAFCEGLDEVPEIDAAIRNDIISNYEMKGRTWLQHELNARDPLFGKEGEMKNPQRMMRALEVIRATGRSILTYRTGEKKKRPFQFSKVGIAVSKEELNKRIDQRVEEMMERGLLNEVKALIPYREYNALQTVGYAELFDHLDGKTSLHQAVDLIKLHTRQYAKRQMTWLRKDKEIRWIKGEDIVSAQLLL